ncbi:MAG: beta-lactamase family protein [Verrucomicrobia bacterium]|nr:beta-lactamase family protein [Verrucomicrobiota bacterium]
MTTTATLSGTTSAKHGFSPQRLERLHGQIESFVQEGKHGGISVLLLRKGQVADFFAVGFRDRQTEKLMQADTIVRIYSLTKIITSVAALTLIEEGKLGLSHPVKDYLPEFNDMRIFVGGNAQHRELIPAEVPINVHHVFTHMSGFTYGDNEEPIDEFYQTSGLEKADSLADFVRELATLPLKREPGTAYEYGFSTDILARVVEVVSGKPFDLFVQERILEPLGMTDTGFRVEDAKRDRLAKVYEHGKNGELQQVQRFEFEEVEGQKKFPMGGSGLFSTIEDYSRFAQMLCNGGELNGVRILSRKAFEQMTVDHLGGKPVTNRTYTEGYGFGLGVAVRTNNGLAGTLGTLGAFGWSGKATTLCMIDPAEELVMLVFTQHLPYDAHGLFERFTNLVYQALV